jgi:hypothetical protein
MTLNFEYVLSDQVTAQLGQGVAAQEHAPLGVERIDAQTDAPLRNVAAKLFDTGELCHITFLSTLGQAISDVIFGKLSYDPCRGEQPVRGGQRTLCRIGRGGKLIYLIYLQSAKSTGDPKNHGKTGHSSAQNWVVKFFSGRFAPIHDFG